MPPHGDDGVTIEAAFIAYCAEARVIDAIKVGSLLRQTGEMSLEKLDALVAEQPWRRGAVETRWVLPHLDDRCRSLPEAELLALLRFAGLPEPEVNRTVELGPGRPVTPDLWWERYRCAAEYEGSQHQEDRGQYNADIDRYLLYRRNDAGYAQVTKDRLRSPRAAVRHVHAELVDPGYDGSSPDFGELWSLLFTRLSDVVRPGRLRRAA